MMASLVTRRCTTRFAAVLFLLFLSHTGFAAAPARPESGDWRPPMPGLANRVQRLGEFRTVQHEIHKLVVAKEQGKAIAPWVVTDLSKRLERLKSADHLSQLQNEVPSFAGQIAELGSEIESLRVTVEPDRILGAKIHGTVRYPNGNLASHVLVRVLAAGNPVAGVYTDSNGNYSLFIDPGTYSVVAYATWGTIDTSSPPVSVAWEQDLTFDIQLLAGAVLEGTVTFGPYDPADFIEVHFYNAAGQYIGWTLVGSNGSWTSRTGFTNGTYYAETAQAVYPYENQLYDHIRCDSCNPTSGTPIQVTAPVTIGNINFDLHPLGSAAGFVHENGTGAGIAALITLYDPAGNVAASTYADGSDGSFSVPAADGTYTAVASAPGHLSQIWDHIACATTCNPLLGTAIPIAFNTVQTIGFDLAPNTAIIGGTLQVQNTGAPTGAYVELFDSAGAVVQSGTFQHGYEFDGLAPGTYYVKASNAAVEGTPPQLYAGIDCWDPCSATSGTPVSVTPAAVVRGIDFHFTLPATLHGAVRGPASEDVSEGVVKLYDASSDSEIRSTGSPNYSFTVRPGTYKLRVISDRYEGQLYDRIACDPSCNLSAGTPIALASGDSVTVDFALRLQGSISGVLKSVLTGNAINGTVYLLDASGNPILTKPAAGTYAFTSLSPGTYYLAGSSPGYTTTVYPNVSCSSFPCNTAGATPFVIDYGVTDQTDLTLPGAGQWLVGTITDRVHGTPASSVTVHILRADGTEISQVQSQSDGRYIAGPFAAGDYRVLAGGLPFFDDYYGPTVFGGADCYLRCNVLAGSLVHVDDTTVGVADLSVTPVRVLRVVPVEGSSAGGDHITIDGRSFDAAAAVQIGGVAASVVSRTTDSIEAITPPHSTGVVDVVVTRGDGASFTAPAAYRYESPAPSIPYIVRDLTPGTTAPGTPVTTEIADVNGRVFFGGSVYDGTNAVLLKDIGASVDLLGAIGTSVFFVAGNWPGSSAALWSTDGTTAGTTVVKTLGDGVTSIKSASHHLYFIVNSNVLWRSDGTPDGTIPLVPVFGSIDSAVEWNGSTYLLVNSGGTFSYFIRDDVNGASIISTFASGDCSDLTVFGNALYFIGRRSGFGRAALYRSDGTDPGTTVVKYFDVTANHLVSWNGVLYFGGSDNAGGNGIWSSDGTTAGTVLQVQLAPEVGRYITSLHPTPNHLFIATYGSIGGAVWSTDGTQGGTVQLSSDTQGYPGATFVGELAGLTFYDENGALWRSDGTAAATVLVKAISGPSTLHSSFTEFGKLWFAIGNYQSLDVYFTDGTPDGTSRFIVPGGGYELSSNPSLFAHVGTELYFRAVDAGPDIYKSDGTDAGTLTAIDVNALNTTTPSLMTSAGGKLFWVSDDANTFTSALWGSDGTNSGSHRLFSPGGGLTAAGSLCYMRTPTQLVRSDGTTAGTYVVADKVVYSTANAAGTLYFTTAQAELWKSDGTLAGTAKVLTLPALDHMIMAVGRNVAVSVPGQIIWWNGSSSTSIAFAGTARFVGAIENHLLFTNEQAGDSYGGLWITDGTVGGTHELVATMFVRIGSVTRGVMYFVEDTGVHPVLWRTDGTVTGTQPIRSFDRINELLATDGKAFVVADDGLYGLELWESDGTVAGTKILADFAVGDSLTSELFQAGQKLYFNTGELTAMDLGAAPALTLISPTTGSSAGGYTLTATGANFASGMRLAIGGVPVSNPTTSDGSTLAGTVNPLPPGMLLDVAIEEGDPVVLPNAFFSDFLDVPQSHPFHSFVEKMVRNGIAYGCGGGNYCVNAPVTRGQMAPMTLRSKNGASYVAPDPVGLFADVPVSSSFARWVEEFYNEGVTAGCGTNPLTYCPTTAATRAQTAVFLLRTKEGSAYVPPPATGIFADVPVSNPFAPWIEELYRRGITAGCSVSPLKFCPNNTTTRGQMAVFLTTTFGIQ